MIFHISALPPPGSAVNSTELRKGCRQNFSGRKRAKGRERHPWAAGQACKPEEDSEIRRISQRILHQREDPVYGGRLRLHSSVMGFPRPCSPPFSPPPRSDSDRDSLFSAREDSRLQNGKGTGAFRGLLSQKASYLDFPLGNGVDHSKGFGRIQ